MDENENKEEYEVIITLDNRPNAFIVVSHQDLTIAKKVYELLSKIPCWGYRNDISISGQSLLMEINQELENLQLGINWCDIIDEFDEDYVPKIESIAIYQTKKVM